MSTGTTFLGSARFQRAGDSENFRESRTSPGGAVVGVLLAVKVRFGGTPKPARHKAALSLIPRSQPQGTFAS